MVLQRLSDTFRKEWTLEADSPPGFYYQGNEIVPHDIQLHYDVPDSTEPEREHSGSSSSGHSGDLETGSNAGSSPARSSFEDTDLTDVSVDGEDEALLKFDDDSYADVPGENQRDTTHLNNIFQVTNLVELVKSSGASKQYYHVQLTTTQLVGIHQQDTTFELLVDTGSNTTYVSSIAASSDYS
ncbi:hypothetical protein BN946_scf184921.g19 [Trametes cinnabarina]|uniref:Uncharacterized protein n=1 Tax=Pycnoporus cinnabarinus TaxID=5643 RepID=A0A060STF8_PYCCI|nr:hypothetical protein BN946_scf184921.g19 [Trametes cinnabarina]